MLALARPSVRLWPGRQADPDEVLARNAPFGAHAQLPQPVAGIRTGVAIASGGLHCLALLQDGSVVAWGSNEDGAVGDGTRVDRRTPVKVVGLHRRAVGIAAGGSHSLALLDDGSVAAWGSNRDGRLGDGTSGRRRLTPVLVGPMPERVIAVAAGEYHSVALTQSGTVLTWGCPRSPRPSTPRVVDGIAGTVRTVVAARGSTFAVTDEGAVFAWTMDLRPVVVAGLDEIVHVAAGDHSQLAMRRDGAVWGWGPNFDGQLADGTTDKREQPVRSSALPPGVRALSLGPTSGLAIIGDGSLWEWGSRQGPTPVAGLEGGVRAIDAGRTAPLVSYQTGARPMDRRRGGILSIR